MALLLSFCDQRLVCVCDAPTDSTAAVFLSSWFVYDFLTDGTTAVFL